MAESIKGSLSLFAYAGSNRTQEEAKVDFLNNQADLINKYANTLAVVPEKDSNAEIRRKLKESILNLLGNES